MIPIYATDTLLFLTDLRSYLPIIEVQILSRVRFTGHIEIYKTVLEYSMSVTNYYWNMLHELF